jgi:hypothetical protein
VKDLQEIPENVKNGLEIVPVKWIDQVLDIALERKPMPLARRTEAAAVARERQERRPVLREANPSSTDQFFKPRNPGFKKLRYNLRLAAVKISR